MALGMFDYQIDAINNLHNGSILCGGVGSGKSRTALAYYYILHGGKVKEGETDKVTDMKNPCDLYIITTARKRDTFEWDKELSVLLMSQKKELNRYSNTVKIDSWNNIPKYSNVSNAFFIFDEQRVVGYGAWSKSFIRIARHNKWLLLSATPGDTWSDYMPVFIANGFYKNKTEFEREHIMYSYRLGFPKVDRYLNVGKLIRLRRKLLVDMDYERKAIAHHIDIFTEYDAAAYRNITKYRWNFETNQPIVNASELCRELRKVANTDPSKMTALMDIRDEKRKVIVFYNFDYELDILKNLPYGEGVEIAEWNGHAHQPIPDTTDWIYLVQYNAGAEGWNCIQTDTIVFYSENYSYKMMAQASGRIDRLNSPYKDLYYYHFTTKCAIDKAIKRAILEKKKFNETKFAKF